MSEIIGLAYVDGRTVHQLSNTDFESLVARSVYVSRISLPTQRKVELILVERGWRFAPDYRYVNNSTKLSVVCPLGLPFFVVPHAVMKWRPKSSIKGYWTLDRCVLVAKKCRTFKEFRDKYSSAYTAVNRNQWVDEVGRFVDMPRSQNRCIYRIINFRLKQVYIGLTYNFKERVFGHKNNPKSRTHQLANERDTVFEKLTEYVNEKQAQELEASYVAKARMMDGFSVLNENSAIGVLGGNYVRWTSTALKKEALKYKTKSEFKRKAPSTFRALCKLVDEDIDEICSHMPKVGNRRTHGTFFTPFGEFKSSTQAAKVASTTDSIIYRRCKRDVDKVITGNRAPKEIRGKTWRELGWYFIPDIS